MACMCGDLYCGSCGPAQGNWKCSACGKWSLDGPCDNPAACASAVKAMDEAEYKDWLEEKAYMKREQILAAIAAERGRQNKMWGNDFDAKNTVNDWVAYITRYVSEGAYDGSAQKFDEAKFREYLTKAATLCVAALEQDSFAPRHYDDRTEKP